MRLRVTLFAARTVWLLRIILESVVKQVERPFMLVRAKSINDFVDMRNIDNWVLRLGLRGAEEKRKQYGAIMKKGCELKKETEGN